MSMFAPVYDDPEVSAQIVDMVGNRTIFNIPQENFEKFSAQIEKLSRKSMKLIGEPIKPVVFGSFMRKAEGKNTSYRVVQVYLMASEPRVDGYSFVARLDHSQETGNIIRAVPNTGITIPTVYETCPPSCDHCRLARRRNDTFLLRCDETKEFKQIGSTCLKDFFGHDPLKIAKLAEFLGYATECGYAAENFDRGYGLYIETETYLTHTAAMIRKNGWTSGKTAYENPHLEPTREQAHTSFHKSWATTDADREVAIAAIAWAQGLKDKEIINDYERNILVIADSQYLRIQHLGLAASIVSGYQRDLTRQAGKKTFTERVANSKHVGAPGERINLIGVEVIGVFRPTEFTSYWTYQFLHDGNLMVWFTSYQGEKMVRGAVMDLTLTVRRHDVRKGVNQTAINRVVEFDRNAQTKVVRSRKMKMAA